MDLELKAALSGIREGIKAFEPRLEAIEKSGGDMQRQLDGAPWPNYRMEPGAMKPSRGGPRGQATS